MTRKDHITASGLFKAPLLCLMLLAMLLRAAIAPGFMPAADIKVPMVICTAYGQSIVYVTTDQDPAHQDTGAAINHDVPCAFASTFATGLAASDTTLLAPVFAPLGKTLLLAVFVTSGAVVKPYKSQGPPVLP